MAERLKNSSPESRPDNQEALDNARHERAAEIERSVERSAEQAPTENLEQLKDKAEKAAEKETKLAKKEAAPVEKRRDTPAQRRSKAKASYKKTMKETQDQLSAPSRTFSKVIHNRAVEKSSEVVGATVARPNAILAGSSTAFLFTLAIYVIAKYYGYPLSGTETIAGFVLGWVVGLLIDYLRVMITGRKA